MSFIKKLVAAVTSALLLVSPASAATKYVATSGSTSWSAGATVGDPITLATFNTNAVAGDVAILANGTYTSAINPQHGGTGYAPTARITYVGNLASPSSVYVTGVTLGYGYATVKGVQHGGNLNISSPGDSVYSVLATAGVPRVSLGGDGANISNSTFTGEQMEFSGGTNGASPSMVTNDTLSDCTFNLNQAGSGYSQAALRVYTTSGLQFNRCRFFINIGANGNHGTWKMYGGRYGKFTDCMFDYTSSRNTTSSGCDECNTSYFRDYTMFNLFQRDTFNLHSQYMMTFMPEASGSFPNSTQGNRYDQCVFRYDGAVVTDHYSALLWYQDGMRSDTLTNCVVVSSTQPCVDLELVGSNCVVKNNTFVRMAAGPAVVVNNTWSGSPQVKRNIFYSSGGGATGSTGAAVSGGNYTAYWALADSNLYYCTNPATSALWLGSGYGVGAGRTACTGFSAECHSAYGDPLFVGGDDPGTFDAHIGSTSPAIALGAGAYSYSTAAIGNPSNLIASYYYNSTPGVAVIYTAASTLGSGTTGVDSIKYATSPITTSAAFSTASNWATKTITDSLGASVGRRANGLDWGTTYYFAVRTTNNLGEQSDILSDTLSTPTYPVVGPPTSFVVSQNLGGASVPRISYSYSLTTTLGLGSTATDSLKLSTSPITNQATFSAASNWTTVNSSAHDGSTKTGTKLTGLSWSTLYYAAIKTTNNLGTSSTIVTDTVMTVAPYLPDTIDYFTAQPEAGVVPAIRLSGDLPPTAVVGGTGTTGTLYVKYSTSPITSDALFSAATTLIAVPGLTDTDASSAISDYMDSPIFTMPAWATTYYVAARVVDDAGAMGVIAADTVSIPVNPNEAALVFERQPLICFSQNCTSNDYPAYTPWKNFLNNAGTAMDTVGLRKLSYFNEVTIPQSALDSASAEGTRMLMLHAVERLRSLRSNIRIYGSMPSFTTWYTSSPSWTGADSTQWKYDIKAQTWVGIRKTAGWATGMGYDTNSPHAVADSTHGPQYLWNKVPGFKGMFSGARYGAETFGGATAGSTNCNAWTNLNLNIAYKSGSTYPVIDTLVSVFVRTILTRRDSNGRYLYDGLFNDLWVWNLRDANYSAKDSVDWARAGYSSFAAMDTAWTYCTYLYALKLREACVANARPNFIITGNYGGGYGFEYLNGWIHEDWPLLQGGTWFSNFATQHYPKTATASTIYGGSMQDDAAKYMARPMRNVSSAYTHGGSLDTGYVGIDTSAVIAAKFRYSIATNCLFDNMVSQVQPKALDNSLASYRINWWPDEFAVNTTTGVASKSYSNTNWLGQPLGSFYNWCPAQPDSDYAQGRGGFDSSTDRSAWVLFSSSGTAGFVTDTVYSGSGALRFNQLTALPTTYWGTGARLAQSNYASNGDTFCVTLAIRASLPRSVYVVLYGKTTATTRSTYVVWADTSWRQQRILMTLSAASPESVSLRIWTGDTTGIVWVDNVSMHKRWRGGTFIRDYKNGSVYVNPYSIPDTVMVASTRRRITSQYSPYINNGTKYSPGTYVIVPATSGLFLVNGGPGGSGDIITTGPSPTLPTGRLPWWKRLVNPHWR